MPAARSWGKRLLELRVRAGHSEPCAGALGGRPRAVPGGFAGFAHKQ